jgi:hypothetical protein
VALFKTQVLVACRGRRFAVTDQGYIGLVPACSVLGDEVFLLGGAPVPFVLRRRQVKRYILVGDAYIHGVMEGEITETAAMDNWGPLLIL